MKPHDPYEDVRHIPVTHRCHFKFKRDALVCYRCECGAKCGVSAHLGGWHYIPSTRSALPKVKP